jgi:hypothetical protein
MKHVGFILLLLLALCLALPSGVTWAMNECQLNSTSAAIDACFRNAERRYHLWIGALVAALVLSIGLHLAGSRWKALGLATVAFGPWLVLLV